MKYSLHIIFLFIFVLPLKAQRGDFAGIDFSRADYIARQYKGEDLHNLYALTHGIATSLATDVERFRAIHYWVCHNVRADYYLMYTNDEERSKRKDHPEALQAWNDAFSKEAIAKLLKQKKTLCTGYAYLIKYMSELMGLECEMVYGYGQTNKSKLERLDLPNHTWNAIKLNGKWYLCDATWSSGTIDTSTYEFKFNYDDTFFLMEPLEFAKTHRPIDEKWWLIDRDTLTVSMPSH